MLNRDKNRLEIFENFIKEYRIQKTGATLFVNGSNTFNTSNIDSLVVGSGQVFSVSDNTIVPYNKESIFTKLKKLFTKTKEQKFNANKFFKEVKTAYRNTDADDLLQQKERIQQMFINAKNNGQTALYEQLEKEGRRIHDEIELVMKGYNIFVEEHQVVEFVNRIGSDMLKLDWIKNFTRMIPDDVACEMRVAQGYDLFDNYVVLHYDPENTGTRLTKKEEEAKKDPILFGVLENSNRLYFIGDWEDEYCDLRLTDIIGNDERVYKQVLTVSKMVDLKAHDKVKLLTAKKTKKATKKSGKEKIKIDRSRRK